MTRDRDELDERIAQILACALVAELRAEMAGEGEGRDEEAQGGAGRLRGEGAAGSVPAPPAAE